MMGPGGAGNTGPSGPGTPGRLGQPLAPSVVISPSAPVSVAETLQTVCVG
jgi:serine/threonine-protein phosphatase 2A regulatory subunit B'